MTAIEARPGVERSDVRTELERLHAESWGWALSCCERDVDLAQDVLHSAYLRILSGAARFDGRSVFKTWVFGVIRMTARSERRRRWSWQRRHTYGEASTPVADSRTGADEEHEARARSDALERALLSLSPRQREVVQLVFYHELTIEEAARVMKVSLGSARTHYDRGKKALARLLAAWSAT